jgi:F1F0 ATPase subunit 2
MTLVDWEAVLRGFLLGLPVSVLFFAGLAWGMRLTLRSTRPGSVLLLSGLCRIAVLLGLGFWVTASADNAWPLAGYALAFFLARLVALRWARAARIPPIAEQEGA